MKKGRKSKWFADRDDAIAGVAKADAQLRRMLRRHPFPGLEACEPVKDTLDALTRVHERLLVIFPRRPKTKPVSEWRHQTVYLLLREAGMTLAEAEELVEAAGLKTNYPEERRAKRT